jgi:hypothetical protein
MQACFPFRFDPTYRRLARLFGVTPERAWVDLGEEVLEARYGRWRVRAPKSNIVGVEVTGEHQLFAGIRAGWDSLNRLCCGRTHL